MKKYLLKYSLELLLLILGSTAAALEATIADKGDIAALVAVTSVLLAVAVLSIRQEISHQIGDAFVDRRILEQIPDAQWRSDAQAEMDQLRHQLGSWIDGTRRVPETSSLNFQIDSMKRATLSIRAIHVARDSDSLKMWDDHHRGYDRLVDAYRSLPDHLAKRRIMVLDSADPDISIADDGQRLIMDDLTARVCRLQTSSKADGGLGFDLRIRWTRPEHGHIANVLIVDDRGVCSIEGKGNGKFGDLEVTINPTMIRYESRRFEDLWTESVPVEFCLATKT